MQHRIVGFAVYFDYVFACPCTHRRAAPAAAKAKPAKRGQQTGLCICCYQTALSSLEAQKLGVEFFVVS